jgi:hypothetical protein
MLKQDCSADSVFEIWYQSCISEATLKDLVKVLPKVLQYYAEDLHQDVKDIFTHWLNDCRKFAENKDNSESISNAQAEWRTHIKTRDFYRLVNFKQTNSRLMYARYQVSGVFLGNDKYFCGNPTYYTLPSTLIDKFVLGKDDMF